MIDVAHTELVAPMPIIRTVFLMPNSCTSSAVAAVAAAPQPVVTPNATWSEHHRHRELQLREIADARRIAADVAVLVGQGPLRRAVDVVTEWARTPADEVALMGRLTDLDPATL